MLNWRLSNLKADYLEYNETNGTVSIEVDGKEKNIEFGNIVDVKKSFLVKKNKDYRVNIIGYSNKSKIETEIKIVKKNTSYTVFNR